MYKHSIQSMQINQSADPLRSTYALEQFFADYRQAYKGNPVGSENAEITQQLLSKKKTIESSLSILAALRGNQLVDLWGTPFFFHAVAGNRCKCAQLATIDNPGRQKMCLSTIARPELGYFSRRCPFFCAWWAAPFCLSLPCLYLVAGRPRSSA